MVRLYWTVRFLATYLGACIYAGTVAVDPLDGLLQVLLGLPTALGISLWNLAGAGYRPQFAPCWYITS